MVFLDLLVCGIYFFLGIFNIFDEKIGVYYDSNGRCDYNDEGLLDELGNLDTDLYSEKGILGIHNIKL